MPAVEGAQPRDSIAAGILSITGAWVIVSPLFTSLRAAMASESLSMAVATLMSAPIWAWAKPLIAATSSVAVSSFMGASVRLEERGVEVIFSVNGRRGGH